MNRIEELLERLRDQTATPEELAELKQRLATPEGRARAREHLWMESALHSAFRATPVLATLARKSKPHTLHSKVTTWACAPFRQGWTRWATAAAAIMILGTIGWQQWQASRETGAILSFAANDGTRKSILITRAGRSWSPQVSETVRAGDTIELDTASPGAELQLDDAKTKLSLQQGAKFRVLCLVPQKHFALDRGSLRAEVAKQPKPMLIQTPTAEAVVLGTVFTLVAMDEQTLLSVDHGSVRLSQSDGLARKVNAGEAALVAPGMPVCATPWLGNNPSVGPRIPQPWIKDKGLIKVATGDFVTFDFETKPKWTLCNGAFWQAPTPSVSGHLCLTGTGQDAKNYGYKAVSPYVEVAPNETIVITGRARWFQGARLWLQYYLCDESPECFGHLNVKPGATSGTNKFVPFRIEFKLPSYADLRFISIVMQCSHKDGTQPQDGDTILLDELCISRKR